MSKLRSLLVLSVFLLTACVSEPLPEGFKSQDDFDPVNAAKTRISLGLTYLQNGNYSQAKFNLDKALQFAPRLADAHYSMAYYYQLVGENELAEESYQTAMDFEPNNADIANTYGAFLCRQGKYDKAKKYFLKAVNSDNYVSTAETYENLALCSQSQGHLEDAMAYLQSAINHQPTRGKSLFFLTQLQVENKEWENAKQTLKRYEKVSRVSAESLWMYIKIEEGLENPKAAQGYGDMLIRMYPQHPRTQQYVKLRVKARPKPVLKPTPVKSMTVKRNLVTADENTVTQTALVEQSSINASGKIVVPSVTEKATSTQIVVPKQTLSKSETPAPEMAEKRVSDYQVEDTIESTSTQGDISSPTQPKKLLSQSSLANETELAETMPTHHVVEKGENLYRISLLYNVKIKRLKEWNNLEEGSSLFVGKKLVIVDPEILE
jgi:type IV pilus assembly protein PilF